MVTNHLYWQEYTTAESYTLIALKSKCCSLTLSTFLLGLCVILHVFFIKKTFSSVYNYILYIDINHSRHCSWALTYMFKSCDQVVVHPTKACQNSEGYWGMMWLYDLIVISIYSSISSVCSWWDDTLNIMKLYLATE